MRICKILILFLVLFTSAHADITNVNTAAGFSRIELAQELPIEGMRKLLGWSDGRIYFAKKDGSVSEVDKDGKEIQVFQAMDVKGRPMLKHPQAIAVSEGTIYVVDSDTDQVVMFSSQGNFRGSFGANSGGGFFSSGNKNALKSPHGIAIQDGIVYVADTGNERVQLFGINGVFLATLEIDSSPENNDAKERGLPYKLNEPTDIAIDAMGQIYVLDSSDDLIKVYSPNGVYLKHLPEKVKPLSFSMARDGIYVIDLDSFVINKYDFKNKLLYTFGSKGKGRAQFQKFSGLSSNMDRQVLVGDSEKGLVDIFNVQSGGSYQPFIKKTARISVKWDNSINLQVSKMAWDGKGAIYGVVAGDKDNDQNHIVRIADGTVTNEIKTKEFSPSSVAVDQNGALWAMDRNKNVLAKLDAAGKILFSFGSLGHRAGELDDPEDFAISKTGVIFVADSGNHRIQVFSSDGVFLKEILSDSAGKLEKPSIIALDPTGAIYALDKDRAIVSVYSSKGEPLGVIGKLNGNALLEKPVALMVTQDEVFVLDSNQVKVFSHKGQFIRSFGTHGSGFGEFDEPYAIVSTGESTFSVSERGNRRLQSFTTLYKPSAPEHLVAQSAVHGIELSWLASSPYVKQYRIFRSVGELAKDEKSSFEQIAISSGVQYMDQNVEVEKKYLYRVEGETQYGYVGPISDTVSGVAKKYVPPALENVKIEPSKVQIKLSWKPVDSQYFKTYLIYQNQEDKIAKIGETTKPEYVIGGLVPDTGYTYYISTLSTDGIESEKFEVATSTQPSSGAPLEIDIVKLSDVFSNTYKLYEQDGIGRITLTNNTDKPIEKIKISFMLNNFMDFPTEEELDSLLPGQSKEMTIKAVFNNNILTISEDSSIQATIEASYFQDGARQVFNKNPTITIYNKHRMTWDEDQRLASFITPKDTPIINFTRAEATQYDTKDETQLAAVLFDALGVMGFTYIQNPIDPYQISIAKTATTEKTDTVDYVQYPRETMERKSGDCVDLVTFYATALESIGISTLMLEVPDHLLMMFSTGINADADGYTMNNMYVIHDGKLWIPVEVTVVGSPFTKAWEIGAANYYKWKGRGLTILDIHPAWDTYKPATLPDYRADTISVTAQAIEKKFPGNFSSILKINSQTKTRRYLQAIEKNPDDMDAYLQIGIILAKMGEHEEAMKYFDKVLKAQPKNAAAVNDRGNIFMLDRKYIEAQKAYTAATQLSPDDPYVWVNLAKSYMATKDTKRAKKAFVTAKRLDASVKEKYKTLSLELLNSI
jgi:DNA-binding beta-propeller fold protein YncE